MKKKNTALIIFILTSILVGACSPIVQTVEVTRIVPQVKVVTQQVTQIVKVEITTTPIITNIGNSTPTLTHATKWTPSFTDTPFTILTITPGLQVINENSRPEVERFVSARYINEYVLLNYGETSFGGKEFCGYQPMGIGNDGQSIKLYIWIVCMEYYLDNNGSMRDGTGFSQPVVLFVEFRSGQYKIVDTKDDGGGMQFVKNNFPPDIQKIIIYRDTDPKLFNDGVAAISQELEKEAKAYFGD